ncbi:hypothetical protein ATE84_3502 [Aquimarina sp. MAR_2010_214]|uniref:DUF6503 family protein n=1 Tax=Aquimarina sp. MAR_2010_214 TaxID=1250026 RepID=UPI000CC830CC|nr:DUF6503 family protein [Aquimarina sp. MAR_2010_214]PKV51417.1 hypothetical protein ATE84_3502 [Aquimarina sp. MAR_2010_214]
MKLKIRMICIACILVNMTFAQNVKLSNSDSAKALIEKMVSKTGNYELLKKLKDVEFTYDFYNPETKKSDISIERYIFSGEVSWGQYKAHKLLVLPKEEGIVTQYYESDGDSWLSLNNNRLTDQRIVSSSIFLRKANYYWFTMMPKLLDAGVIYKKLQNRTYNKIDYNIVKIGFEKGVGEVQDDFILYINPTTFLVDRFLFTVKGSGLGILMMEIKYETVNGYTFMAKRKVIPADWDGNLKDKVLYEQITKNVKFNNGFKKELLAK